MIGNIYSTERVTFGDFDREALRQLLHRIARPQCRVVEIGSWLGTGSTQILLEVIGGLGEIWCVDTWMGSQNVPWHQEVAANYDPLATFRHNTRDATRVIVSDSLTAAALIASHTFDLVFIDGDHSLEVTSADIAAWRAAVRPGGILCGHDCEGRTSTEAIDAAALGIDFIQRADLPLGGMHPGCIVAVDRAFGGKAHLWSEELLTLRDGRLGRSSLWDVTL